MERDKPTRYALDPERPSVTVKFTIYPASDSLDASPKQPFEGYFVVGFYDDGTPGELFV